MIPSPQAVLQHWVDPADIVSIDPIAPGMSGAALFRVTVTGQKRYALKRYPIGTSLLRVDEIHRVMTHSRRNGCEFVPAILAPRDHRGSAIEAGASVWELVRWVGGRVWQEPPALLGTWSVPTPESELVHQERLHRMSLGASAIARFHRSVATLGTQYQPAPCLLARRKRLTELAAIMNQVVSADRRQIENLRLRHSLEIAVGRLDVDWKQAKTKIESELASLAETRFATQFVLRDVHCDHIFFSDLPAVEGESTQTAVTGIIDFDAVRVDAPASDLARWISGFLAQCTDVHTAWQSVLAGYRVESSLDEQQQVLAERLVRASAWINLGNWATWLLLEHQTFSYDDELIANRIDQWLRVISHFES
ncbi:phosphotransferase [Novipirellula galeiformis]|nr:aminoglycoside phosphotransferase family protein [Novipirellula galeiformis]